MIDLQRVASLFRPPPAATTDLNLLDSRMVYSQTQLDHIWYEVEWVHLPNCEHKRSDTLTSCGKLLDIVTFS